MNVFQTITLLAAIVLGPSAAYATTYPVTVTDVDGQNLVISHEPKHVVLQDGRDILGLALLDRDNPFQRLVAWNNLLKKSDGRTWQLLDKKWPDAANILDMGFSDQGEVNVESVIAEKPDLLIAQLRAKPALAQAGVLAKMNELGIPVVFIDTMFKPVENTPRSIQLLGTILNRESQAKEYVDFYQAHYHQITERVANVKKPPQVFIEAKAGLGGLDSCCFTHAHVGWGGLVEAVGARNIGSELLPGPTGDIAMEKVISLQPDVYIVSGSQWAQKNNAAVPFGYGVTQQQVNVAFRLMEKRTGFSELSAIKNHRFYGIYHNFYNHPYNIVGMEYLAKFIYPHLFNDLDPARTYDDILLRFTKIPQEPGIFASQAPAQP